MVKDELTRKREMFSNNINRIRKHKNKLKFLLKKCCTNRNKVYLGLEDLTNPLLHFIDIKLEIWFRGKLNSYLVLTED